MLVSKRSLDRRKSQKKREKKQAIDKESELQRLSNLLNEKQEELKQSQRLNRLYLNQINKLQDDNLSLCVRLEELKAIQQRLTRQLTYEAEKMKGQIEQLLNVISYLQRDNQHFQQENRAFRSEIDGMIQNAEAAKLALQKGGELGLQLQKAKLKVFQSQKYWMTRCETLLSQKQTQLWRRVAQKESQYLLKIKLIQGQVAQKQRQVQQKTEEIYKLIAFIHSKNN